MAPWLVKLFVHLVALPLQRPDRSASPSSTRGGPAHIGRWERLALSGFIFSTFLVQMAMTEAGQGPAQYYSVTVPLLGLPVWVPRGAAGLDVRLRGGACSSSSSRWSVQEERLLPPIVLLPAVTQFVWFVLGWKVPSLQRVRPLLPLAAIHADRLGHADRRDAGRAGRPPIAALRALRERALGPRQLRGRHRCCSGCCRGPGAWAGFTLPFATAVVLSAVQIHHFFVDGVIWKLQQPAVSSPLLSNVSD